LKARPDWAGGLRDTLAPGELAAQQRLKGFLGNGVAGYTNGRDRPDRDRTHVSRRPRAESGRVGSRRQLSTASLARFGPGRDVSGAGRGFGGSPDACTRRTQLKEGRAGSAWSEYCNLSPE
jgi:deoxyribodipyrimidine photo-lyase